MEKPASFKKQFFLSSFWSIFHYGGTQILRLISNLLLVRLLVPEDFGAMQLVVVFLVGIQMFSDTGLRLNIIQSPKGEDHKFLQASWTVQLIRNIFLFFIIVLIAQPYANFYQNPELFYLVLLQGISIIFEGITSTNLALLSRRMELKKIAKIELFSSFMGIASMVIYAYYTQSVYALCLASIVSSVLKCFISYSLPGPKMALIFDGELIQDIFHFGKWIFVGSIAGFLVGNLDRLFLGKFLGEHFLGLYGIAFSLASVPIMILTHLSGSVLFPVFSSLKNESFTDVSKKIYKMRLALLGPTLLFLYSLIFAAPFLVNLLYPDEYSNVAIITQLMSIGFCFTAINRTLEPIVLAQGKSLHSMLIVVIKAFILFCAMYIGITLYGQLGCLVAVASVEFLAYPFIVCFIKRYRIWAPKLDLLFFLLSFLVIYMAYIYGVFDLTPLI